MHRDIVFDIPAGCTNLATSPICGVQGLYLPKRVLSVQGHPEFHEGIMSSLLEVRHASGLFNDELYKDGLSRVGNPHDGRLIAKAMAKFIVEAQSSES
jgi:GMP synthase (glutamine-hydrolysing)